MASASDLNFDEKVLGSNYLQGLFLFRIQTGDRREENIFIVDLRWAKYKRAILIDRDF